MGINASRTFTIDFCHGQDRRPVDAGGLINGSVAAVSAPFHGIIGRGLFNSRVCNDDQEGFNTLMPYESGVLHEWTYVAPLLEEILNHLCNVCVDMTFGAHVGWKRYLNRLVGRSRIQFDEFMRLRGQEISNSTIVEWVKLAIEKETLTYARSARAACCFIERFLGGSASISWNELCEKISGGGFNPELLERCELWSIKEGHTSSIWRVELSFTGGTAPMVFCLNVGRDKEASEELKSTSEELIRLHKLDPQGVVEVLGMEIVDLDGIRLDGGHANFSVTVSVVRWLENSSELHVAKDPSSGFGHFMLVDYFRSPEDELPASMQRIVGKRLDGGESEAMWSSIIAHMVKQSEFDADCKTVRMPSTEINEGDWVSCNEGVMLVAASKPKPPVSLGMWVLKLLFTHARKGGSSELIYRGNIKEALESLGEAVTGRGTKYPSMRECIDAAKGVDDRALDDILPVSSGIASGLRAELMQL
jgi:hypothetical protein